MNIFERIGDFVDSKDIEIHILKNKVYIENYIDITDFNNNKITIKYENGNIYINGKNLVITKLLGSELLICGKINNIELR